MIIVIDNEQNLRTVSDLHQRLLAEIVAGACTMLDIRDVTDTDIAFVQTIESARRHADAVGAELHLAHPAPQAVLDLLDRAGFAHANSIFWNQGPRSA